MADRVIVFMDWQNVYQGARRAFHDGGGRGTFGQVRPGGVGEMIAARGGAANPRELEQVRVYRGFASKAQDRVGSAAARMQRKAWERHPKVRVFPHTLQRQSRTCARCGRRATSETCPECGNVRELLNEKGVDVNLAIDLVSLAYEGAYDVGVVFSTDTDFNPAIKLALRLGVTIENAVWWANIPHGNQQLLPDDIQCHKLRLDDYESVRDKRLYVPRWAR